MQITKVEPSFIPVSFTITFDTQKELDVFRRTMNCNISVPELMRDDYSYTSEETKLISQIMEDMATKLIK